MNDLFMYIWELQSKLSELTLALVSGQVYLLAHTNSVFRQSRKRPAPVADTFTASRGCPPTGTSTVADNTHRGLGNKSL